MRGVAQPLGLLRFRLRRACRAAVLAGIVSAAVCLSGISAHGGDSQIAWTPLRRSLLGVVAAVVGGSGVQHVTDAPWPRPAVAADEPFSVGVPPGKKVVDLGNALVAAQEDELEAAIATLEQETPYRFRFLSPPAGRGPSNKAEWLSVAKTVKEYWAKDPKWDADNLVVMLVDRRVVRGIASNPVSFTVATKLTERLQYRIASDTFSKIAYKFGDADYLAKAGEEGAVMASALNAVACLRKGVCMQPLPEDEARSIALGRDAPKLNPEEERALAMSQKR